VVMEKITVVRKPLTMVRPQLPLVKKNFTLVKEHSTPVNTSLAMVESHLLRVKAKFAAVRPRLAESPDRRGHLRRHPGVVPEQCQIGGPASPFGELGDAPEQDGGQGLAVEALQCGFLDSLRNGPLHLLRRPRRLG